MGRRVVYALRADRARRPSPTEGVQVTTIINKLLREPAVVVAVVIAGVNTATDHTWQGYAAAVLTALIRFVVSPVAQ